jgi:hypothetical protein
MLKVGGNITKDNNIIYGVDITKKIEPVMVRDAIIKCFYLAHNDVLELEWENFGKPLRKRFEMMKMEHVRNMVLDIFKKIDGNFNKPTKKDLFRVIENLKDLASDYREPKVIKNHFTEILLLVEKL